MTTMHMGLNWWMALTADFNMQDSPSVRFHASLPKITRYQSGCRHMTRPMIWGSSERKQVAKDVWNCDSHRTRPIICASYGCRMACGDPYACGVGDKRTDT